MSDSIAIFSGGLDSTTLVYHMLHQGMVPHLLSFNYGQRHNKELEYATRTAYKLGLRHDIVDLTGITHLISNSALTSPKCTGCLADGYPDRYCPVHGEASSEAIEVPEGHYAEDNMKKTVVPNRNMIMLSIAAGIAVNNSYERLATGVHSGDHFVYPDCREEFIQITNAAIMSGNKGFGPFDDNGILANGLAFIYAPFLHKSKADIAYKALELGVPLESTWSCYKGGEKHCGKCGTCVERLEAIDEATGAYLKAEDKTEYEDTEFWKEAIKNA